MRSRVDLALRAVVLALLAWRLVLALRAAPDRTTEGATSETLGAALARWTTVSAPGRIHAVLDYPPSEVERDWLAALPGAGTAVAWSGPDLLPTAIGVLPVADPGGGADILVSAPPGSRAAVGGADSRADTTRLADVVARVHVPHPPAIVEAAVGPVRARGSVRDSLGRRRLLVLGRAGWETKFTIAALEERGWTLDARIAVAPAGDVSQGGARAPLDTSVYSAVIAVDSTAGREAARIARFVRSGGGLLLSAAAADAPGLRALAPGRAGEPVGDAPRPGGAPVQRSSLQYRPLVGLRPDAVTLERRDGQVVTAARREGIGRVVQTGNLELWRWRMAGGDGASDAHRAWLARLVAGVARTVRTPRPAAALDPAPLASLIDRLGPPSTVPIPSSGPIGDPLRIWAFAVLCAALLAEWLWRRLHSRP